ncbi:MAG: hypothetical protein IPP08_08680 [Chlorobiota bacterium]|nr:MAG: hypothetical protein IPP08_08680 [Chlorobiota bacterium]
MSLTIYDFIQETQKQIQFHNEQIKRFDELINENKNNSTNLKSRRDEIILKLSNIVAPHFSDAELLSLSNRIQNSKLSSLNQNIEEDKITLSNRISEISKNDLYIKRVALTDPKSGVIKMQLDELNPMYNKAVDDYNQIVKIDGFEGLYNRKFGTDLYPHKSVFKYFNSEYLNDWKRSDEILKILGEKDFVDVISKFNESKRLVDDLGSSIQDLKTQEVEINKLTIEFDESSYNLKNINQIYKKKLAQAVINFSNSSDKTSKEEFVKFYPDSELIFTTLDGLNHQSDYLNELNNKIMNDREILLQKSNKLADEANRYQSNPEKYSNKSFDRDKFHQRFNRDKSRYTNLNSRYHNAGNQIYEFNDYGRASLLQDFLWYDLMTDGRLDGNFIPQVQEYYNYHPDYNRGDYNDNNNEIISDNS